MAGAARRGVPYDLVRMDRSPPEATSTNRAAGTRRLRGQRRRCAVALVEGPLHPHHATRRQYLGRGRDTLAFFANWDK